MPNQTPNQKDLQAMGYPPDMPTPEEELAQAMADGDLDLTADELTALAIQDGANRAASAGPASSPPENRLHDEPIPESFLRASEHI